MSRYTVCARTHPSGAMIRLAPVLESPEEARDALVIMEQQPSPRRNYELVAAIWTSGRWRAAEPRRQEEPERLTPEELAIVAREEAAYAEAGGAG